VRRLGAELNAALPRIDVLINNAGAVFTEKKLMSLLEDPPSTAASLPGAPTSVSVGALPCDRGRGYVLTSHVGAFQLRFLECGLELVGNPARDQRLRFRV